MTPLVVLAATLGVLAVLFLFAYNALVRRRNKVEEAWSGIDVQLQRRSDLIPNLVSAVEAYAAHERAVFKQVADARAAARAASGPLQTAQAETVLGGAVARLMGIAEAYPELKAGKHFLTLQRELTRTEDEIAASRRIYNGNVQIYNTRLQTFPTNVWAPSFGFAEAELFEAAPATRLVASVSVTSPA